MILESLCMLHFLGACILVGLFILIGILLKPDRIIYPMPLSDESKYDTMSVDSKDKILITTLKENSFGPRKPVTQRKTTLSL
jgi:hypothetical protein